MSFANNLLIPLMLVAVAAPVAAEEEDFNTQLMRATVKISHGTSTGTGFVLTANDPGKALLVTAAHVFDKTRDDETEVVFRSKDAEDSYKKSPLKLVIRHEGKPAWTRHPTEDVAAIWVVPPANADLPKIPLSFLASDELLKQHKIHPGEILACLGFPHRNEANDAGFPLLRVGAIAEFPLVPTAKTKAFFFSVNSFEGDSGGPVYLARSSRREDAETRLILGLITGQQFLDEEAKMIYGTTKIRHRLGLAVVVHASFIKETIDLLP